MNTQLSQDQIDKVKAIVGTNHGHTFYNNAHHFFAFYDDNIYSIFSKIQDLGLQVVIGWTYYDDNRKGNTMIQFAVIPQQIKV